MFGILVNLFCYERQGVWSQSMPSLLGVASVTDFTPVYTLHPSVDMGSVNAAVRVVPQGGTQCILALCKGDCAQALHCYWSLLSQTVRIGTAVTEVSSLTDCVHRHCHYWSFLSHRLCAQALRCYWSLLSHRLCTQALHCYWSLLSHRLCAQALPCYWTHLSHRQAHLKSVWCFWDYSIV
jgi:hypothetical protein